MTSRLPLLLPLTPLLLFCLLDPRSSTLVQAWPPQVVIGEVGNFRLPTAATNPDSRRSIGCVSTVQQQLYRRNRYCGEWQQPRCPLSTVALSSSSSNNNHNLEDKDNDKPEPPPTVIPIETLSSQQLVELIDLAFFQACLGLSKGHMEPLQLFLVAVLQSSASSSRDNNNNNNSNSNNNKEDSPRCGYDSPADLIRAVDSVPQPSRPLDDKERELRATWIHAVYWMQRHVNNVVGRKKNVCDNNSSSSLSGIDDDIDPSLSLRYPPSLLDELISIHQSGLGLNAQKFVANRKELLLTENNKKKKKKNLLLLMEDDEEPDDPVELAIVTQTIKVLYQTLVVMEEEDNDSQEEEVTTMGHKKANLKSNNNNKHKKRDKKSKSTGSGRGFG